MDKLDQLHVVSDLHLGGATGHQVNNQGPALARLIDHLASADAAPAGHRVGLALNGDIVDFLAAEGAMHFDPRGAPQKLAAIMDAPEFSAVFDALGRFARAADRVLVLVLGNHDVELALPAVQQLLLSRIVGDDDAARGRLRIAMDGAGYTCFVGDHRVLTIHGNDMDPWNVVDHQALRDFVKAEIQGAEAKLPPTNAGTRLVIDVMNDIKEKYAFVDLLKPETVPVSDVLLALPASFHPPLLEFAKISLSLAYEKARKETGFLGADAPPPTDGYRALEALIRASSASRWGTPGGSPNPSERHDESPEAWLAQAERDFAAGKRPVDLVGQGLGDGDGMLGMGGLIWDRLRGNDPRENLRDALNKYLGDDRTFAFDTEDDVYKAHDEKIGTEVSFIVTGHTHLERRLPRKRAQGVYFNTGTWIRLIQIRGELLTSTEAFDPVYRAISSGSIADLDAVPGLVLQRRTMVSIWAAGDQVHGELRRAAAVDAPAGVPWEIVAETRFSMPSVGGTR